MENSKYLIWSDDPYYTEDLEDYKARMEECCPEELDGYTENMIYERMAEENADMLDCERMNLNIDMDRPIIGIIDLDLWDGHRRGYTILRSENIKDCLQSRTRGCSYNTFYVSEEGEFCHSESHHDGTNQYIYRVVDFDLSEEEVEDFMDTLHDGDATREYVMEHTKALGPVIAQVYGWDLASVCK